MHRRICPTSTSFQSTLISISRRNKAIVKGGVGKNQRGKHPTPKSRGTKVIGGARVRHGNVIVKQRDLDKTTEYVGGRMPTKPIARDRTKLRNLKWQPGHNVKMVSKQMIVSKINGTAQFHYCPKTEQTFGNFVLLAICERDLVF